MAYYATQTDTGITVRQAESIGEFRDPADWREVTDVRRHANANGVLALDAGKIMTFTQADISYPELNALFAN